MEPVCGAARAFALVAQVGLSRAYASETLVGYAVGRNAAPGVCRAVRAPLRLHHDFEEQSGACEQKQIKYLRNDGMRR
jgi:hypothetical protein